MKTIQDIFMRMFIFGVTVTTLGTMGCSETKSLNHVAHVTPPASNTQTPSLEVVCTSPQVSLICVDGVMFGLISGVFQEVQQGYTSVQGTWASQCNFNVTGCTWQLQ